MNAGALRDIIKSKIDELFPGYSASAYSISTLENPVDVYINTFMQTCITQLINDAPLLKLSLTTADWAMFPDDEYLVIKQVGRGEKPRVLSYDKTDDAVKVMVVQSGQEYDVRVSGRIESGVRNIKLSTGEFFRKVYDGYDSVNASFHECYIPSPPKYMIKKTLTQTAMLLPNDFARFVDVKCSEWVRPVSELSECGGEIYKMQFSAARNGVNRPLAFRSSEKYLELFPVATVAEARYIPTYIPQEVPEILVDAYTWLCASQVLAQIGSQESKTALEFYKIAIQ